MNPVSPRSDGSVALSRAQRINEVCDRFELAWQAGQRPRIEDFLGDPTDPARSDLLRELIALEIDCRRRAGEQPTLAEYQQRFPEQTAILHQAWESAGPAAAGAGEPKTGPFHPEGSELPNTGPEIPAPSPEKRVGSAARPSIPGYEILGELGRGGMGVVYKANQVRLKRLVALKMILAGGHASEHELARFRTEAEAVARLQHPNIVQIHEVGEHNGLPYFSLEFVASGSLAQQLDGTPWPPRPAAQLVTTLARAMHAAHQRGIIHRDLKPANILLERGEGRRMRDENQDSSALAPGPSPLAPIPKIADFGLAKKLDASAAPTASGVVVGTPSYMAPEQARGKTSAIGPAVDIYALGAILYELLTGRRPFRGPTALEIILQVIHHEPVAPCQLQPRTPRDLETICLKCLTKEPQQRYESAEALAEDLQRFLDDKPILARRPTLGERAAKWARRHKALMWAAGVFLVLAFIGLAAGSVLIWQKNQQYLEQLDRTRAERKDAREAFNRLVEGIADELDPVLQDELLRSSQTRPLRQLIPHQIRLLERASQSYAKCLPDPDADPEEQQGYERAQLNYGRAYVEIGNLRRLLAEPGAKDAYEKAVSIFEQFVDQAQDNRLLRVNLARSHRYLGEVLLDSNQSPQAVREHAEKAVAIDQGLVADFPDYAPYRQDLALCCTQLGMTWHRLGQPSAAEEQYRRALDLWDQLVREDPQCDYRDGRAHTWLVLAPLLDQLQRRPEAEAAYRAAAQSYRELLAQSPETVVFRQNLAAALANLAGLLYAMHQVEQAAAINAEAVVHLDKLATDFPQVPDHRYALAQTLSNQGFFLKARLFACTVACLGQPPLHCLLPLQVQREGLTQALHQFDRAYTYQQVLASGSATPAFQSLYRQICWRLASTLVELGDHVRGAEVAAELARIPGTHPAVIVMAARLTAQCLALTRIDSRLTPDQQYQQATHDTSQGLDLLRQALKQGYKDVQKLQSDPELAPLRASPEFEAWWRQQAAP